MTTTFLDADIMSDEGGCILTAYPDTLGILTVGVGHAHVARGTVWTRPYAMSVFADDRRHSEIDLDHALPWWRALNPARQDVLANMAFNMGIGSLVRFYNTLAAMHAGNWQGAHDGMLASKWAGQVHGRARRLAQQMLTGERIAP